MPLPKSESDDDDLISKNLTTWIDGYREDDLLYLDSNGSVLNYTNDLITSIELPGKNKFRKS